MVHDSLAFEHLGLIIGKASGVVEILVVVVDNVKHVF